MPDWTLHLIFRWFYSHSACNAPSKRCDQPSGCDKVKMFQTADRKTLVTAVTLSYAVDIPQPRRKSLVIGAADSTAAAAAGTCPLFTVQLIWFYVLSEPKPGVSSGSRTLTVLKLSESFNSVSCAAPRQNCLGPTHGEQSYLDTAPASKRVTAPPTLCESKFETTKEVV